MAKLTIELDNDDLQVLKNGGTIKIKTYNSPTIIVKTEHEYDFEEGVLNKDLNANKFKGNAETLLCAKEVSKAFNKVANRRGFSKE